jgi:hypothetical protein
VQSEASHQQLRILFICGSLEPGRDGVGDYTRRLAGELIRQGNRCGMVALNDRHAAEVQGSDSDETQEGIPTLRLPAALSWQKRTRIARSWVESFSPDWGSLQLVPYSYHEKGIPLRLSGDLLEIARNSKWHIMFHELWIGANSQATLRHRLVGAVQRKLICHLLQELAPCTVTTHSVIYMKLLEAIGVKPHKLPLFGNIPRPSAQSDRPRRSEHSLRLLLFGGIHPNAPVEEFAMECARISKTSGREIRLILAGRSGHEQQRWRSAWVAEGLAVETTGELPAEEISKLLVCASFGISTTPLALIEKSGSVAAMLEHSLPVINVAASWVPRGCPQETPPEGIYEYKPLGLAEIIRAHEDEVVAGASVQSVALDMIHILNQTA